MRNPCRLLMLTLLPLVLSAAKPSKEPIEVYFSPNGGCTDAVVREIAGARHSLRIQAYSFMSTPIAKATIDAKKRGVKVEAVPDKPNRTGRYMAATFPKNQGVDVLIDDKHAIAHNKVMIIDDAVVISSSFNFTKAAEESNAEKLPIIRAHADLVRKYVANYDGHHAHSAAYEPPKATEGEPEKRGTGGDNADGDAKFVGSRDSDVYH